ncbi:MAG: hypothetical protein WBV63_10895 [Candidatus Sulfotelmatobacter sp.]
MRDAGREQHQIGEAPPVEREIADGCGLSVDQGRSAADGDVFESAGDAESELKFGSSAHIHVKLRSDLRRHILRNHASGVVAGRQQVYGEPPFRVRDSGVARARRRVDHRNGGAGNAQVV